jgi:hypothetical protein
MPLDVSPGVLSTLRVQCPARHSCRGTTAFYDIPTNSLTQQIEDHPLVSFLPLDLSSPDSLETVISHIDYTMQYGEDEEPKEVICFAF